MNHTIGVVRPGWFQFSTGQLVSIVDIASISAPRQSWLTSHGRWYVEVTYKQGATITIPDDLHSLMPQLSDTEFVQQHQHFIAVVKG